MNEGGTSIWDVEETYAAGRYDGLAAGKLAISAGQYDASGPDQTTLAALPKYDRGWWDGYREAFTL